MNGQDLYRSVKRAYLHVQNDHATTLSRAVTQRRRFVENELSWWGSGWSSMPLRRRLWLWRHGFLSRADPLWDVDPGNYREYLTDYQREVAAWINGQRSAALDDKLLFHWMMEPFAEHRVRTYGLLRNGRFHDLDSLETAADGSGTAVAAASTGRGTRDAGRWVGERLRSEGSLVVKPCRGGGGSGVRFCSYVDGAYRVDGAERSADSFEAMIDGLDEYLVTETVEQAAYARDLFAGATNTIRVLTMYDDATDEPYVPIVAHRIGTRRSAPVDNFSNGGLTAEVDRETGDLGPAVGYTDAGTRETYETHPDTGARIDGVTVPGWSDVLASVRRLAAAFSHTPYIGWDVVVTGDGEFAIIEANNSSGVTILQVHRPLLRDPRTRRFFERHGVVPVDDRPQKSPTPTA